MNEARVKITTTLKKSLWEEDLKSYAENVGKDRNEVIEEAVQEYLNQKIYEFISKEFVAESFHGQRL